MQKMISPKGLNLTLMIHEEDYGFHQKNGPFFPVEAADFITHGNNALSIFKFDVTSHSSPVRRIIHHHDAVHDYSTK